MSEREGWLVELEREQLEREGWEDRGARNEDEPRPLDKDGLLGSKPALDLC